MSRRVLLLARQSLTRADSVGITTQVDALTRHYEARGDTIVATVTAENTRGWKEDRADLTEALAYAERGAIDIVAVYAVDRLARSVRILETVVHELAGHGVGIDSLNEPGICDPLIRQVLGALAESFSRSLSRRMTHVVSYRVSQGRHQGPAPFGFVRGDDDRLVPGPDADAARAMFALRIQGRGRLAIARILKTEFGTTLSPGSILRNLRNPAYAGGITGPGGALVWDAHPPIVSRQTWDAVQTLLAGRTRAARSADPHWLEGLCFCGCGQPLYRAETQPGSIILRCGNRLNGRPCPNPRHGIALHLADAFAVEQFAADVAAVAAAEEDAVLARLVAAQRAAHPSWEKERERLSTQRRRLLARRERFVEMRADGDLTRDVFRERAAAVDTDVARIDARLAAGPVPVDATIVARTVAVARTIADDLPTRAARDPASLRAAFVGLGGRLILLAEPEIRYAPQIAAVIAACRDS